MAALGPQAFTSVELKALALAEYGDPSVLGASGSPSNALTPYAGGEGGGSNSKGTSAQEAAERRAQVACTSDNMEALEVSTAAHINFCSYSLVHMNVYSKHDSMLTTIRLCLYSTCGCELLLNTQPLTLLHVCMILEQLLHTSGYTIAPLLCSGALLHNTM
eukprot:548-Heterococcus_DN1.PRE.1